VRNTVVSKRYAQALFELATDQNQIEKIHDDLNLIANTLNESKELNNLTSQPMISKNDKKDIFGKIFGDKVSSYTINFIKLLIDKKRETMIGEISEEFENMVNQLHSKVVAKVYTAVEVEQNELSLLRRKLEGYLDKQVDMETHVDKEILGGVLIKIGDRVIDGTVRTRFENMAKSLR
jgi:F-type H+-transporting ATPase subunit delta